VDIFSWDGCLDAQNYECICLNEVFYNGANIMRFVVASAVEAGLRAPYHNCQKGIVYRKILSDMRNLQPNTPVHWDNATAVGIANYTVKRQLSCSMEMRLFGVSNKCAQDLYILSWRSGQENLADYQSKYHLGAHHTAVCTWYLHMEKLHLSAPSFLKGCVGTLHGGYLC
jgi:hypothetical protein